MIKNFDKPNSLNAAIELLNKRKKSIILAGGTFLTIHTPKNIDSIIDLSKLKLNYVKKRGNSLAIGALTTFTEIADSNFYPHLADILANAATEPLRNMITAGGNVMQPLKWSDLPVIFCALEAEFKVVSQKGTRKIPADIFFKSLPSKILNKNEMLTEITIPKFNTTKIFKKKIIRSYDDLPAAQLVVAARSSSKKIKFVKLTLIANKPLPIELIDTGKFLTGKTLTAKIIDQAIEIAKNELPKFNDIRFSNEYLQEVIPIYIKRLIKKCIAK